MLALRYRYSSQVDQRWSLKCICPRQTASVEILLQFMTGVAKPLWYGGKAKLSSLILSIQLLLLSLIVVAALLIVAAVE